MNKAAVDLEGYPIIRLDQIVLCETDLLIKAAEDASELSSSLVEEAGNGPLPPLVNYLKKQVHSIKLELAQRSMSERVNDTSHEGNDGYIFKNRREREESQFSPRTTVSAPTSLVDKESAVAVTSAPAARSSMEAAPGSGRETNTDKVVAPSVVASITTLPAQQMTNPPPNYTTFKPLPLPSERAAAAAVSVTASISEPDTIYSTNNMDNSDNNEQNDIVLSAARSTAGRRPRSENTNSSGKRGNSNVNSDDGTSTGASRKPPRESNEERVSRAQLVINENFGSTFCVAATEKRKRFYPKKKEIISPEAQAEKDRQDRRKLAMQRLLARREQQAAQQEKKAEAKRKLKAIALVTAKKDKDKEKEKAAAAAAERDGKRYTTFVNNAGETIEMLVGDDDDDDQHDDAAAVVVVSGGTADYSSDSESVSGGDDNDDNKSGVGIEGSSTGSPSSTCDKFDTEQVLQLVPEIQIETLPRVLPATKSIASLPTTKEKKETLLNKKLSSSSLAVQTGVIKNKNTLKDSSKNGVHKVGAKSVFVSRTTSQASAATTNKSALRKRPSVIASSPSSSSSSSTTTTMLFNEAIPTVHAVVLQDAVAVKNESALSALRALRDKKNQQQQQQQYHQEQQMELLVPTVAGAGTRCSNSASCEAEKTISLQEHVEEPVPVHSKEEKESAIIESSQRLIDHVALDSVHTLSSSVISRVSAAPVPAAAASNTADCLISDTSSVSDTISPPMVGMEKRRNSEEAKIDEKKERGGDGGGLQGAKKMQQLQPQRQHSLLMPLTALVGKESIDYVCSVFDVLSTNTKTIDTDVKHENESGSDDREEELNKGAIDLLTSSLGTPLSSFLSVHMREDHSSCTIGNMSKSITSTSFHFDDDDDEEKEEEEKEEDGRDEGNNRRDGKSEQHQQQQQQETVHSANATTSKLLKATYVSSCGPDDLPGLRAWKLEFTDQQESKWEVDMSAYNSTCTVLSPVRKRTEEQKKCEDRENGERNGNASLVTNSTAATTSTSPSSPPSPSLSFPVSAISTLDSSNTPSISLPICVTSPTSGMDADARAIQLFDRRSSINRTISFGLIVLALYCEPILVGTTNIATKAEFRRQWGAVLREFDEKADFLSKKGGELKDLLFRAVPVCGNCHALCKKLEILLKTYFTLDFEVISEDAIIAKKKSDDVDGNADVVAVNDDDTHDGDEIENNINENINSNEGNEFQCSSTVNSASAAVVTTVVNRSDIPTAIGTEDTMSDVYEDDSERNRDDDSDKNGDDDDDEEEEDDLLPVYSAASMGQVVLSTPNASPTKDGNVLLSKSSAATTTTITAAAKTSATSTTASTASTGTFLMCEKVNSDGSIARQHQSRIPARISGDSVVRQQQQQETKSSAYSASSDQAGALDGNSSKHKENHVKLVKGPDPAVEGTAGRGSKKTNHSSSIATTGNKVKSVASTTSTMNATDKKLLALYPHFGSLFPASCPTLSSGLSVTAAERDAQRIASARTLVESMQMQAKVYEEWMEVMSDYSTVFSHNQRNNDDADDGGDNDDSDGDDSGGNGVGGRSSIGSGRRGRGGKNNRNKFALMSENGSDGAANSSANATVYQGGSRSLHYRVKCGSRPEVHNIVTDVFNNEIKSPRWEELPAGLGLGVSWNVLWTWSKPRINMNHLLVWQQVNHFRDAKQLTRKDILKKNLQRYTDMSTKSAEEFCIMPVSFILPGEYNAFVRAFTEAKAKRTEDDKEKEKERDVGMEGAAAAAVEESGIEGGVASTAIKNKKAITTTHNLWILKPIGLSRGRGITMVQDLDDCVYSQDSVIQKYIERPLCLGGYKFDLRLYVVVTSFRPLEAFVYRDGFARVSTQMYSVDASDRDNLFIHLTNSSIQKFNEKGPTKDNPLADKSGESDAGGSKITLLGDHGLWNRLAACGIDIPTLWNSICLLIVKSLVVVDERMVHQPCCFELYGYDVLIDADLRPWLIEVNSSPSLAREHAIDKRVKNAAVKDLIMLLDPAPYDRAAVARILRRRLSAMTKKNGTQSGVRSSGDMELLKDLKDILGDHVPRLFGEVPKNLGGYEMLAPNTKAHETVLKLKRKIFKS